MSGGVQSPFMAGDYYAEPANVLSTMAGRLAVLSEWVDEIDVQDGGRQQVARISAELQFLIRLAQQGSWIARRWAALPADEQQRARDMLRGLADPKGLGAGQGGG